MNPLQLLRTVAATQNGVVTSGQCRQVGLHPDRIKYLCRQRTWLRLNRGSYLVDAAGATPSRRARITAAALSAGTAAVVVLDTAAELHGIAGLRQREVIHLSLPGPAARPRRSTEPDVRLHQFRLRPDEVTTVDGLIVTTVARTLADLALRVDRYTAICLLDSALGRRLVEDLELVRASMTSRPGARRARPWLLEADGRAESPLETRVRLRAIDGGVGPDELQFRVRDRQGDIVAITDLAWTRSRIVGEADGAEAHDNPSAIFRDRTRQNAIVAAGYTPLRFTWADTLEPPDVPRAIRRAMAGAGDPPRS